MLWFVKNLDTSTRTGKISWGDGPPESIHLQSGNDRIDPVLWLLNYDQTSPIRHITTVLYTDV